MVKNRSLLILVRSCQNQRGITVSLGENIFTLHQLLVKFTIRTDHGSLRWLLTSYVVEVSYRPPTTVPLNIVLVKYMVMQMHYQDDHACFASIVIGLESREGAHLAVTDECNCISLRQEQSTDHNLNLADAGTVLNCAAS